jgi:hypothetical protein
MFNYLANLSKGKTILWCYLIWYSVTTVFYFDPSPRIWLNSVGISVIIGIALLLSVSNGSSIKENKWQTFRLFLMPFCVSSFSSLIKGQGYVLIFPPNFFVLALSFGLCGLFVSLVVILKVRRQTH